MSKLMTNGQHYSVTLDELKKMDPCERYSDDDFKYAKELFNGRDRLTLQDILELDIYPVDKVWISDKIVSRKEMAKLQVLWAYQALSIFEREFPNDDRPRTAIQKLEAWINNPSEETFDSWLLAKDDALTAVEKVEIITDDDMSLNIAYSAACAAAREDAWIVMSDVAEAVAQAATRMIVWHLRNAVWVDVWDAVYDAALDALLRDLKNFATGLHIK